MVSDELKRMVIKQSNQCAVYERRRDFGNTLKRNRDRLIASESLNNKTSNGITI